MSVQKDSAWLRSSTAQYAVTQTSFVRSCYLPSSCNILKQFFFGYKYPQTVDKRIPDIYNQNGIYVPLN